MANTFRHHWKEACWSRICVSIWFLRNGGKPLDLTGGKEYHLYERTGQAVHTCEPPDGRDEFSSFFRSSPVLKYPPVFSWLLHVPPVFSWLLHVHVPNVQFAPCAFRPRKQDAIWMTYLWYFESLHSAEVFYSHFKICFNNFIYPPWVDYFTLGWWLFEYLLASTVNFKIYIFKID